MQVARLSFFFARNSKYWNNKIGINWSVALTWVASVYGVFDVSFTCCDPNTVIVSWYSTGIKSFSSLASSSDVAAFPSWDCWGTIVSVCCVVYVLAIARFLLRLIKSAVRDLWSDRFCVCVCVVFALKCKCMYIYFAVLRMRFYFCASISLISPICCCCRGRSFFLYFWLAKCKCIRRGVCLAFTLYSI